MVAAVNRERAAAGVGAVSMCASLQRAAQAHSTDQAQRSTMSHTGGDGSTLSVRADRAGYAGWRRLAENVAAGQPDVASVVGAWMRSPGHRANLLDGRLAHIGVGRVADTSGRLYWTQNFGTGGRC